MAGRALVFSNPDVIHTLETSFVPYAGDQWYLHRQQDAAGRFFWKVAQQGYLRGSPPDDTRQGLYVVAPDGTLLASDCFRPSAAKALSLMNQALARWREHPVAADSEPSDEKPDVDFARTPPERGLILNVYTRIARTRPANAPWSPNEATGRDHMWMTKEEARSLLPREWKEGLRYPLPASVAERLERFHLVDDVRGEPDMWRRDEIEVSDLSLVVEDAEQGRLRLEGRARMRHETARGYDARIQGCLVYDRGSDRFSRFDLLAWGEAWGEGRYTGGAPAGRFPLVVAFSLAGRAPADLVPPQGSRDLAGYMGQRRTP